MEEHNPDISRLALRLAGLKNHELMIENLSHLYGRAVNPETGLTEPCLDLKKELVRSRKKEIEACYHSSTPQGVESSHSSISKTLLYIAAKTDFIPGYPFASLLLIMLLISESAYEILSSNHLSKQKNV